MRASERKRSFVLSVAIHPSTTTSAEAQRNQRRNCFCRIDRSVEKYVSLRRCGGRFNDRRWF